MPDMNAIICTRCKQSCYNTMAEGPDGQEHRLPIYWRLIAGIVPGESVDFLDPNLRMTSVARAMHMTPLGRHEYCDSCLSELFGMPQLTPSEDPMVEEGVLELQQRIDREVLPKIKEERDRLHTMHVRSMHAIQVARGVATPADLPDEFRPRPQRPPHPESSAQARSLDELSDDELEAEFERRRALRASS